MQSFFYTEDQQKRFILAAYLERQDPHVISDDVILAMARLGNLQAMRNQQQQPLGQEVSAPTIAERKVRRKNLLHGCKLCPEKSFPVSAQSKSRTANPSVEGHVLKEHPGMEYTDLTRRWGYHILYENGSFEKVPFIDHVDEHEQGLGANASYSQSEGFAVDHYLGLSQQDKNHHSIPSEAQVRSSNNYTGFSSHSTTTHYDAFGMPVILESNRVNQRSENWFSENMPLQTYNEFHAPGDWRGNAPSAFDELPVLALDEDQFRLRVANISPFDPNDSFDNHRSTQIDPLLMAQGGSAHGLPVLGFGQHGAQYTPESADDNENTSDQISSFSSLTEVQKTSEYANSAGYEQDQMNELGLSHDKPDSTFAAFELMQKHTMEQKHRELMSHGINIPFGGNLSSFQDRGSCEETLDGEGQSPKNMGDLSLSHGSREAGAGSSESSQNTIGGLSYSGIPTQFHVSAGSPSFQSAIHAPPATYDSSFKLPTTTASAYGQVPECDRSSQSLSKQDGSVKTPTPSPRKRKASTPHPQTPKPKSRRSNVAHFSLATSQPPLTLQTQVQFPNVAKSPQPTTNQPGTAATTLKYNPRGPAVFQFNFKYLHPLDQQALTGHQGEPVTTLSRFAFFGHDANAPGYPRNREKQLLDMIAYLRGQRDALYKGLVSRHGNGNVDGSDGYGDTNVEKDSAA